MKDNNNQNKTIEVNSIIKSPTISSAFDVSDEEKIDKIAVHFKSIMETLGLDLSDDSLKETPKRVAKMYVTEIFSGLNPKNKPEVTLFKNNYGYNQMLVEKNISVYSMCEHHFVPIIGKAHVAYIANGKVIGLSKIHRMVKYFSQRPQVQERLTRQIMENLKQTLNIDNVAVVIDARHMCVECRGVEDVTSNTITSAISGQFQKDSTRSEFMRFIGM
ncbi:MAG: GTP cyclohydrolase I FolE [Bacteroidia bacterium]|nr:GTP cyclohydrolase I FolE [Bacteroidia bacterium]